MRFPTHVEDIAKTLIDLVKAGAEKSTGIFHVSGNQRLTKFEMAKIMADILGLDASQIIAADTPTQTATRPYNCALQDTRLKQLGINHQRDFAHALRTIL